MNNSITHLILDAICVIILIVSFNSGKSKGGVRAILELLSFVVTILAVTLFKDVFTEAILSIKPVAEWVENLTQYFVEKYSSISPLADMVIPPEEMGTAVASFVINILGFIVTYIAVKFIFRVVLEIGDIITSLPFIKSLNNIIGGAIGAAKGIVIIWVLMIIMLLFTATKLYEVYMLALDRSFITKLLYEYNIFFTLFK